MFDLRLFPDAPSLAQAAADTWHQLNTHARTLGPEYHVALSGGRIANAFFDAARQHAGRDHGFFHGSHFYWADERCVPPDDPQSNYWQALRCLFAGQNLPASRIHRIHGELEPEAAARLAAEDMALHVGRGPEGVPVLDLIILGMGEDGHVASLFPGKDEDELFNPQISHGAVVADKPPPHRVTLTYPVLKAAREVMVLISGEGKKSALRRALSEDRDLPLGKMLRSRLNTRIFTDVKC